MNIIQKIAAEIIKESFGNAQQQAERKIRLLFEYYMSNGKDQQKENVENFSKQVGKTIKDNQLSMIRDRKWITDLLQELERKEGSQDQSQWVLKGNDFVLASLKRIKK